MKDHRVIARLLSRRGRQILRHRTLVLATGASGAIHDLRVATRRLQEALEFLAPALPARPARRLGRRARRIRRELGTIRNLDVLLRLVAGFSRRLSPAQRRLVAPLAGRLAEEAAVIRRRDALALPGIRKRVLALESKLILPADFSVRERARQVLTDRALGVASAMPPAAGGDALALHTLRIAVKRYRYTLEILDQTGTRKARPAMAAARALQKRLGELHDLDVFLELLPRAASPAARSLVELFATRRRRLLVRTQTALASFDPRRLTRSVLGEPKQGAAA